MGSRKGFYFHSSWRKFIVHVSLGSSPLIFLCLLVNEDSEEDESGLMPNMEEVPEDAVSLVMKRENSLRRTLSRRWLVCSVCSGLSFHFFSLFLTVSCFSGTFPEGRDMSGMPNSSFLSMNGKEHWGNPFHRGSDP